MGFCPNCGSWVDEGDTCGCCGGSGSYSYGNDDENYYGGISQSDYGYSSDFDITQQNKRHLRSLKSMYEHDINRARIEKNGVVRLRCYMEAVANAERYWRESRK